MGTILVLAALAVIVGLIVRSMARDRKNGKSSKCGGDCGRCSGCH